MMRILGSILILILLNLSWLQAGSITSRVEHKEILKGESVILSITIVGVEFDTLPDIPRIGGAKVLGSKRSVQSRILTVEGKAVMEQTAVLMLEFKPTTPLSIPSFQVTIDGELKQSEPIDITIVKERVKSEEEPKFLMEMNATKERVMVGEPLIVNVYFKQRKNIEVKRTEYSDPLFKGFSSERIGDEKSYDDGNYTVHKLSYVLLAKEEGDITIDPVSVKISYKDRESQASSGWFSTPPTWISAESLPLHIQAINPSESFDVMGSYRVEEDIDTQVVAPNKPVNLKLILDGEGSLNDFDGLMFNISGVTVYSDNAKIEHKIINDKLFSTYTKSYVFISDHDFIIPSNQIMAYDYNDKSMKNMRTKPYSIKVDSGLKSSASSTVYTKHRVDVEPFSTSSTVLSKIKDIDVALEVTSWMYLLASFLLGSIVTLLLYPYLANMKKIKLFGSKKYKMSFDEALTTLYPHMNDNAKVEDMVRTLYDIEKGAMVNIDKEELEYLVKYYHNKESEGLIP